MSAPVLGNIFYHHHAIPNGSGYLRETCLAPLVFDEDGRIEKGDPLAKVVLEGPAVGQ